MDDGRVGTTVRGAEGREDVVDAERGVDQLDRKRRAGGGQVGRGQDQLRVGDAEHRGPLTRRQPAVHPCGDRPNAGRGQVGDGVLGDRWQAERDDVARLDPPILEARTDRGGQAVEVGVRQLPTLLGHVGGPVAEPPRRLCQQLSEQPDPLRPSRHA